MIEKGLVSIITPLYNSEPFVLEAIESVQRQSYPLWELIVVNDCSGDSSVKIVESLIQSDSRVKLINLDNNSGPSVARNIAIEAANGQYIAFLDSDDIWQDCFLEKMLYFMQKNQYEFVFSAYQRMTVSGKFIAIFGVPEKVTYSSLLKTCVISCLTAMYDAEKIGKRYFQTSSKREDFLYWLQILKDVEYAYGLNESLAYYRFYSGSSSSNKATMAKETWKLYRNIEGLGFFRSLYYFVNYAVRGFLRIKYPWLAKKLGVLN